MWTKSLFWKRDWKRIYDTCPEIRPFLEEGSRNIWMNAIRLLIAGVPFAALAGLGVMFVSIGGAGAFLIRVSGRLMDWIYRDTDYVARAHEVLSAAEIRRRTGKE